MLKKILVWIFAILSYADLLRVPLGFFVVEIVFRYFNTAAYLKGMYDLQAWGALSAGAAVFLLWLALTVSFNTTVHTASRRFDAASLSPFWSAAIQVPGIGQVWRITTWCAVPFFGVAIWLLYGLAEGPGGLAMFAWGVLGFGLALALVLVVYIQFTQGTMFSARVLRLSDWTKQTPSGYRVGDIADGPLEDVHRYGFTLMAISIISFTLFGLLYRGNPSNIELATLPCVVLILANFCWLLSAITYFLDRWRIPLLLPLIVFALMPEWGSSDHLYPVRRCPDNCRPAVTATAIMAGPEPRVIVATSGGGILASAWTVHILGTLEDRSSQTFSKSLRLISSVSGGSVGAMYYVSHLHEDAKLNSAKLFEDAASSSLEDVAWGLTYPDTFRTLWPYRYFIGQEKDRGKALREAWKWNHPGLQDDVATLAKWPAGANHTPAIIMNATVEETGERFIFANYSVRLPHSRTSAVREFFNEFGNTRDVSISVAAGASAAFPYVSPAARADVDDRSKWFHLLDGGYFDNFGVASVLDFLQETGTSKKETLDPLLLVLIEASPAKYYLDQPREDKSWAHQLIAPPSGLIGMWQIAARARNYDTLKWIRDANPNLRVIRFVYEAVNDNYPTSWHLGENDQREIKGGLDRSPLNSSSLCQVAKFLKNRNENPTPAEPVIKSAKRERNSVKLTGSDLRSLLQNCAWGAVQLKVVDDKNKVYETKDIIHDPKGESVGFTVVDPPAAGVSLRVTVIAGGIESDAFPVTSS